LETVRSHALTAASRVRAALPTVFLTRFMVGSPVRR
jgi:hypothetical protein